MKPEGARAGHYDIASYFALAEAGLLSPDDHTELLEGLIVSMAPQNPAHAATVWLISSRLTARLGNTAMVRTQFPLLAGSQSVPEPDVAVVPWRDDLWQHAHPDRCLLAIEVSDSSLAQDRLTKSRIYAAAGVEDYWIVNLRSRSVEWHSDPQPESRMYAESGTAHGLMQIRARQIDLEIAADELFPPVVRSA